MDHANTVSSLNMEKFYYNAIVVNVARYNNYDRAVISTVPHDVVQRWYVAHRQLTDELRRPENELWVKLKPGKVTKPLDSITSAVL